MRRSWWIVTAVAAWLVVGCDTAPVMPDASERTTIGADEYRIGPDDRLQVTVWRNPELSVTAPVRPDGKISVPLIGDVDAGGRTPAEVSESIKKQLSVYIREPNVAVIVIELHSHEYLSRVRVTGAVRTPKSIPYRQGMTVLDVVLEAGGTNDFASPNSTKLYRKTKDKTQVFDIDLGNILNKGRLETNFPLRPGDVVTVPERLF
jgi:polysaccharide export outer membrane protein